MIWTNELLTQLTSDAGKQIAIEVNCVWRKIYIAVTVDQPLLLLPAYVKSVTRMSWRGVQIDPVNWADMEALTFQATAISNADQAAANQGRPSWYAQSPTNVRELRLYPTPNESLVDTGDPYSPTPNEARCSLSCWCYPDDTVDALTLPRWANRRTRKAYALWQAYSMEGKGQDLKAASYYKLKFDYLIARLNEINSGLFVSTRPALKERSASARPRWKARPRLPSNFEDVELR